MKDSKDKLLGRFMREFFPFSDLRKVGFFTPEMRGDYAAQAKRVCEFFGFETVYEYRKDEMRGHLSYDSVEARGNEPFVTIIPSIYD